MNNLEDDNFDKIFKKAIKIIYISPQFEKTLSIKLKRYTYNEKIINKVINKLKELNYLNDYEYAKNYAKTLITKKGYSNFLVLNKLIEKGIKEEEAKNIIEELNKNFTKEELLSNFIKKHKNKFKKYLEKEKYREIINTFYKYGFSIENHEKLLNLIKEKINDE